MNRTPNTSVRPQAEPESQGSAHPAPAKDQALDERDLDAVVGGVKRRGPGTQTEDDVYVG